MKLKVVAVVLLVLTSSISSANSVVNGTSAVGSSFVVAFWIGDGKPQAGCTGAYLRPRIVVTAAHCVIKGGGRAPEPNGSRDQYYVSQPGIDLTAPDAKQKRVRVLRVWTEPDYFNRWEPEKNLKETQINDLAFLFLERELDGPTLTRAATREEIEDFRLGTKNAFHLGYGMIGGINGTITSNDGKPYLVEGITGNQEHPSHIPDRERHLIADYPYGKSIGPGDSGSPLLMNKGNEVLYLGTIYAGGGWADIAKGNTSVRGVASVTVLWPFIKNLDEEWSKFLAEEEELRKVEAAARKMQEEANQKLIRDRNDAVQSGIFYRDESACHANGISAELQGLVDGNWVPVAETKGWDKVPNCPITHPVQPWTFARLKEGLELRWRFWLVNQFEVYGPQFRVNPTTQTKVAADLKNREEANTKASADKAAADKAAADKAAADKAAAEARAVANKKKSITCIKGKVAKKVTAIKPKCPTGYKKK